MAKLENGITYWMKDNNNKDGNSWVWEEKDSRAVEVPNPNERGKNVEFRTKPTTIGIRLLSSNGYIISVILRESSLVAVDDSSCSSFIIFHLRYTIYVVDIYSIIRIFS